MKIAKNGQSWLSSALPFLLAALPPLYLLAVVLASTVDVPFADQWALVPLLDRWYRGALTIGDLWAQHNEHRLLFPRLIMLGLARLSGWNTHAEMLANIVLAGGIFAVLVGQVRASARSIAMAWAWLVPVLSLAVFSLNQAENWWGGWNIQIFLNVLAVSAGLVALASPALWPPTLALALACGVVASYSYSNGLLIWPLGLALLAARRDRATRHHLVRIVIWICGGAATLASFFYHYRPTGQMPALGDLLGSPTKYVVYALTYLGAAPTRGAVEYLFGLLTGDARALCNLGDSNLCDYVNTAAVAAGATGLVLFVLIGLALLRRLPLQALLPYLALGAYAIGAGALTSLGRASYGNHQALAQRYATGASLFWMALVVLLALYAHGSAGHPFRQGGAIVLVVVFSGLTLLCSLQGPNHFRWQYEYLAPARDALIKLQDDELLQRLYPDPQVVRRDAPFLKRYHLSVFR